jgi:hypothetical protein
MDIEKLNLKKVFAVACVAGGIFTVIYAANTGAGLLWALVIGVTSIPMWLVVTWILVMGWALLYEGWKLLKPLLKWFFK